MNINKILKWTAISSVFALIITPFITSSALFFPFITGKGFFFRVIIEIGSAAWLLLAFRDASFRPKKSWLLYSFVIFTVTIGVADMFGVMPWKSFWSNFERMEGYITILHLLAYFIVAGTVLSTEKLWKKFLEYSVGASVLISLYSVFQLFGVFTINQGGVRVDSTLGNAAYLAIYLVFNIFLALILFIQDKKLWKKVLYGVIVFLHLIILYYTATRGAILGVLGGLALSALLIALFDKAEKKRRIVAGSIVGLLIVFVLGFIAIKNTSFVQHSPVLSRFASISWEDTKTQARSYVWPMALKGWQEHPILGWGQENFNYVFNAHYDPAMYAQEQWFDRAHNSLLDWLIAGGLLGFLAYLSLFIFALCLIWKKTSSFSFLEKSLLTGLGAAYFFNNLFVFDNLTSYLLFVSVLAFIHFRSTRLVVPILEKAEEMDDADTRMAGPLILICLIFVIYFFNWRGFETNIYLINALRAETNTPVLGQEALDNFSLALSYDTLGQQEVVERMIEAVQSMNSKDVSIQVRQKFYDLTKGAVEKLLAQFPGDARYEEFAGSFYSAYNDNVNAEKYYQSALAISTQKQSFMYQLGNFYIANKRYGDAVTIFKKAYDLETSNDTAAKMYALALLYAGQQNESDSFLQSRLGNSNIALTDDSFLQAYVDLGEWAKVIAVLKERVAIDPTNSADRQNLIAAYIKSGDKASAIKVIRDMISIDPTFQTTGEQYIQAIQAGK